LSYLFLSKNSDQILHNSYILTLMLQRYSQKKKKISYFIPQQQKFSFPLKIILKFFLSCFSPLYVVSKYHRNYPLKPRVPHLWVAFKERFSWQNCKANLCKCLTRAGRVLGSQFSIYKPRPDHVCHFLFQELDGCWTIWLLPLILCTYKVCMLLPTLVHLVAS